MIPLNHYLIVSAALFAIGAFGVLTRRNLLTILLSLEIMVNAVNLSFVSFSSFSNHVGGQIAALLVIAIAAVEVAVGLAIAVVLFKKKNDIRIDLIETMKG